MQFVSEKLDYCCDKWIYRNIQGMDDNISTLFNEWPFFHTEKKNAYISADGIFHIKDCTVIYAGLHFFNSKHQYVLPIYLYERRLLHGPLNKNPRYRNEIICQRHENEPKSIVIVSATFYHNHSIMQRSELQRYMNIYYYSFFIFWITYFMKLNAAFMFTIICNYINT